MDRPKVSALLPIKNGAQHVNNVMSDLIACTNEDDEILVVNDHSSDATAFMLSEWVCRYDRIRVVTSDGYGLVNALNTGIAVATNDWIARFDCDDRYPSDRLSLQFEAVDSHSDCIFSDYEVFMDQGVSLGIIPSPVSPTATRLSLWRNARTPHPSAVFRKDKAILVGGYLESDFPAEDLSLWLRLSEFGALKTVPSVLLQYTMSSGSVTGTRYSEAKFKANTIYAARGINLPVLRKAIKSFKKQAQDYRQTTMWRERTFLHFVDIIANCVIMRLPTYEVISFAMRSLHFYYFVGAASFLIKQNRRKRFRSAKPNDLAP